MMWTARGDRSTRQVSLISSNKGDGTVKKDKDSDLECLRNDIIQEIKRWNDINENGCNDPFWPDGCNMNLVRNHILYYRKSILEICIEHNVLLPEEYYIPVPPEVSAHYMANLNQKERVERLRITDGNITTKKTTYEDYQMSFIS